MADSDYLRVTIQCLQQILSVNQNTAMTESFWPLSAIRANYYAFGCGRYPRHLSPYQLSIA